MKLEVTSSKLRGEILIPASKSHTIRAITIASMAKGRSILTNPLRSADATSCVEGCRTLGAIITDNDQLIIEGIGNKAFKTDKTINVGNSGTTLRILTAIAALSPNKISFDGDQSIRKRPMNPLIDALKMLGATIESNDGKCPFTIQGPIKGGKTVVDGISSQFLTAILLATPLAEGDTEITVENLHEQPYVEMTLDWLNKQNIEYENSGLNWFKIKGNQSYKPFNSPIPADFSSATFALCAAAITQSKVLIKGLDFNDSQGDKEVFNYFSKMGISLKHTENGILVKGSTMKGCDIDMNATPDALPAMAVAGCIAEGETKLYNVKQARFKECDRIAAIKKELSAMGADITELDDGLIIRNSKLKGTNVHGYDDHRMVMSLALAGMVAEGKTIIDTADSVQITYPSFVDDFLYLGAHIKKIEL